MSELDPKIAELEERLDQLVRTQIKFQTEVSFIRTEIERLRSAKGPVTTKINTSPQTRPEQPKPVEPVRPPASKTREATPGVTQEVKPPSFGAGYEKATRESPPPRESRATDKASEYFSTYVENAQSNLEKFIGENLISKIGIIVLVLGVGIGAKYAIDKDLISPITRIILGYIFGLAVLGTAVKLKPKYHNFSAVLISGGMAIMYFITYFAYAAYGLMPQPAAFILMVMFTVFTVAAAIFYARQIIAHVGLVGAYAVPFLLSNNSGNYLFLFSYMAILNTGVLAVSIKKAWKPVFYTASSFTWLIMAVWLSSKYQSEQHFYIALVFLGVFFSIFYATKIAHGIVHPETDNTENVVSTIVTAILFYGFGLAIGDAQLSWFAYAIYFSFFAVFGLVILLTSFRYYGRVLVFVAYPLTWLIFGAWFFNWYKADEHFTLAAVFATVFFLVFYAATLIYRLLTDELGMAENAGLVMTNSFVFYGFGYGILDSRESLQPFEGLFTAGHAVLHSLTAQIVNRFKTDAVDVVQVLAILIITFTTIAIPVQLDGNFVTLMWSVEAAALFFFGRQRGLQLFEALSYPVMFLAACSMAGDWIQVYQDRGVAEGFVRQPFANGDFITGLVFVAAFAFIYFVNAKKTQEPVIDAELIKPLGYLIAGIGLFALYNTFRMEIGNYFHIQELLRRGPYSRAADLDLGRFNVIAQIDYTMLFLIAMAILNLRKARSVLASAVNIALSILVLFVTATVGSYILYALRASYVSGNAVGLFGWSGMNVAIRYVTYTFVAGLLVALFEYSRDSLLDSASTPRWRSICFDAVLYPTVLILASCDLMNVAVHLQINDADKFGLSILWGVFALAVIVIGIAKAKQHLRIGAIVLLAGTLVKLFFYDVTDLPTIPKTILFVSLGLLMLIVSFLYNKYKNVIFGTVVANDRAEEE